MERERVEIPERGRTRGSGAWAAYVAVVGLLLFTWPFLRTPPLDIGRSYAHLLGAWIAVIAALALLARRLGRGARARGPRA